MLSFTEGSSTNSRRLLGNTAGNYLPPDVRDGVSAAAGCYVHLAMYLSSGLLPNPLLPWRGGSFLPHATLCAARSWRGIATSAFHRGPLNQA